MKHFFICIAASLCITFLLQAQIPETNDFFSPGDTTNITYRLTLPKATSLGKHYLDNKWNAGNVYLKTGEKLLGYYLRYDLVKNRLEIIVGKEIRIINKDRVESFEWFNVETLKPARFINGDTYQFDKMVAKSFFEVLASGKATLLKQVSIKALRNTTSPTLVNDTSTGNTEKFEEYFLGEGDMYFELSGSRKKKSALFNSGEEAILDYVRNNNLNLNVEKDMITMVEYYNELNGGQAKL